jgi:hypothetical protein
MEEPYIGDNDLLAKLKNVVEQYVGGNKEFYYSQIYSWFDLNIDGCMSPIDYPDIANLHEGGRFNFHFLWGCVENCAVLWQPPTVPLPHINEWPVLLFDNEGYVGYAGSSRQAVAQLLSNMENEIAREGNNAASGLAAFVADAKEALDMTQAELDAAKDEALRAQPNDLIQAEITELASLAVMY